MKIKDFIADHFFSLPKNRPTKKDFSSYISEQLEEFIRKLQNAKIKHEIFSGNPMKIAEIIKVQQELIDVINDAIGFMHDGKPADAYDCLSKELVERSSKNLYKHKLSVYSNLYRIRMCKENYPMPPNEFFHIPFEMRGKVKTQRFSIPGFPSLYLGNTVYVCWEELRRPPLDDFQIVRLSNVEYLSFLNLVPPLVLGPASEDRLFQYLMSWPLIFAASIKVNNPKDTFKPEYIIPQLLLQWIRKEPGIDGVMYQTTHINFQETKSKGQFINFVLPVKSSTRSGLCEQLLSKFEMTQATSIQLNDICTGSVIDGGSVVDTDVNLKIQKLEIIKDQVSLYSDSKLGELELKLLEMKTKPIKR